MKMLTIDPSHSGPGRRRLPPPGPSDDETNEFHLAVNANTRF